MSARMSHISSGRERKRGKKGLPDELHAGGAGCRERKREKQKQGGAHGTRWRRGEKGEDADTEVKQGLGQGVEAVRYGAWAGGWR